MKRARKTTAGKFLAARDGAIAVEFAMIAPVFLMIVFGIIMYGSYLAVIHGVQQLAAEAARSSVAGLNESERSTLANSYITGNVNSYPLINPAHLTVNAATSGSDANVFVVTVNYDASSMFIYSLPTFVPAPSPTIVRSAAIPRGGY
ncbi:pilus assembly protein [Afipia massiliensis]|uniref:Pilus assembly protein n=1 Tax=Afipia massiliensis TaxID=211460 RepID=A0A4U6BNK7_9BRAD|nr:TadE/TadG family type IV pilus assembly protein [Afipia massiliensis]TKT71917.1 pilus assembly protein [Afipia massiliensis]